MTTLGLHTVMALGLRLRLGTFLKFRSKRFVVEKGPRVVEFAIPGSFQISHCHHHILYFFVSYKGEEGGVGAC